MPFNFNARQVFLTYPRCTLTKEEVWKAISDRNEVEQYTVAREMHADGTPHIHAVFLFTSKVHTTNERYFDVAGFHCNIKGCKTKGVYTQKVNYIKKDGDFISNIKDKVSPRTQLILDIIDEGPRALENPTFIKSHPALWYLNFSSLRQWISLAFPKTVKAPLDLDKARHIWLWGPSNSGKTTYLRAYRSLFYNQSEIPLNNDYNGISEYTELLWLDEFRGQLSVQQLNRLADGDTKLNTKGGSTAIGFPTIFIVSNFQIRTAYPDIDPIEYRSLLNRFKQYDMSIKCPPFPYSIIY